jgi:hypothetical protein
MTQVSVPDVLLATLLAEIRSRKATKRSLGVVYAQCVVLNRHVDPEFFGVVNKAILDMRNGDPRYLDHVKRIGWPLAEEIVRSLVAVSGRDA